VRAGSAVTTMFDGFRDERIAIPTDAGTIAAWIGGDGPPLLLLHGYPQTRTMWHKIAPRLVASGWTVVAPDLRGYGESGSPEPSADGATHAKREMARDQVALMSALGFSRFDVIGHDRGGRVAHRLALDASDAVARVAVLDILPTRTLLRQTDLEFATAYWHWFFLLQPGGLPERMIGADPEWFVREILSRWSADPNRIDPGAADEYVRRFTPAAVAASCADYRAAAGPDLAHDDTDAAAGRKVTQPLLALWGAAGAMGRMYDVLASWHDVAERVRGAAIDSGHFLAEEAPTQTLAALEAFLTST
jgi:haloacetate dehalogenase